MLVITILVVVPMLSNFGHWEKWWTLDLFYEKLVETHEITTFADKNTNYPIIT